MSENKKGMALDDDVLDNVTGGWGIRTNEDGSGIIEGKLKVKPQDKPNILQTMEFTPETKQEAIKWAMENLRLSPDQEAYYNYMMSQNAENN